MTTIEIRFWSIFAAIGVIGFILIVMYAIMESTYEKYNIIPDSIKITPEINAPFTRIIMKFSKWRQIFEMNPSKFVFIKCTGEIVDPKLMNYNFRYTSPCFQNESNEFILIDFRFREYISYYFYKNKIHEVLSYPVEISMTKEVAEDAQKKIQKILDESQRKIENALESQREIVLRLNQEENKLKE